MRRSLLIRHAVRAVLGGVVGVVGFGAGPRTDAAPPTLPHPQSYTPPAANATPLPCAPGACGATGPTSWLTSGSATFTVAGSKLTVNQSSANVSLNWSNFDIGANASVNFKQPSATAIALNKIFQSAPSQIFGALTANGQVYLINQNGFVFGKTASVNVGGLLASSLALAPDAEKNGILDPALLEQGLPALASDGRVGVTALNGTVITGADGNPAPVEIVVQPGAQLTTNGSNQRLMLAAPAIDNSGSLTAPNGQIVLAAGQQVFLTASADPNLRGLIVEVDGGGAVTNQAAGNLSASLGNISIIGLAVNQLGRASATTSVTQNGSVYLLAQDSVQVVQQVNSFSLNPQRGGTVTLGPGSVTQVLPDNSGGTTVDAVAQPVSTINLVGQDVYFQGGSTTLAPGGNVSATAAPNPSAGTAGAPQAASIRVDPGALIDVSGSSASVPVTRNVIEVELTGTELADDPLQRGGFLNQQSVFIDTRVGTPLANVSGEVALTQRGVDERTAAGGKVNLASSGDVVVASGATINVSGGQVDYTPGYIQTTDLLTAGGSIVNIGSASPNQTYVGVYNPTVQTVSDRWGVVTEVSTPGIGRYDPGYVQGANAGSVSISAPGAIVLQGNLQGAAVAGINQRTPGTLPLGGQLVIGAPGAIDDERAPAVQIVSAPTPVSVADNEALPTPLTLQVPLQTYLNSGFDRIAIGSNNSVTLAADTPLTLAAGGSIQFTAPRVELDSSISAPGGSLSFQSLAPNAAAASAPPVAQQGVYVGDGAVFDVRGNWTNDALLPPSTYPTTPILLSGGSISLSGGGTTLSIGNDVSFEASGGAWLSRTGQLHPGAGGHVILMEGPGGSTVFGNGISLDAFGAEGAAGGSLSLTAPRIQLNSASGPWESAQTVAADPNVGGVLNLNAALLSDFGFSSISLTADGARLTTDPSATNLAVIASPGSSGMLRLTTQSFPMSSALVSAASAPNLASVESPAPTPDYRAAPSSLSLSATLAVGTPWTPANIGGVSIGAGSQIEVGPGGSVALSSDGSISVMGSVTAPGGLISATVLTPAAGYDPGFVPGQRIEVGPSALLDTAGTVVYTPSSGGFKTGTVYGGGSIDLHADRGSIVVDGGALLDFAGTQALLDVQTPALGATPVRETVASSGGTLTLSAPESISLLGTMNGAAGQGGSGSAAGGTLNITLSRIDGFVSNNNVFPTSPRTIVLQTGGPAIVEPASSGVAIVDPKQLAGSGIDALAASADQIQLTPGVEVSLGREVVLQAPALLVSGNASISAPYVSLGGGSTALQSQSATAGNGTLSVNATESLNLSGALAIQGASSVTLASGGVLSLTGNYLLGVLPAPGDLQVAGNLTIRSTAVEPSTATGFTISALSAIPGTSYSVTFVQSGPAPSTPLSVAGALTVNADVITQGGTLLAPFGTIALNGTQSVTMVAGSKTSVSGDGTVLPYGIVEGGSQWVYGQVESLATPISGIPTRSIALNAPSVSIAKGSSVDVSGGGDVYAYQWIPGPGGTRDALSPTVSPNLYAILPSTLNQFAPYDILQYAGSSLTAGQSVYLSGGGGIAPGYYPLLPARYALLPGAILISVAPGYSNLPSGTVGTAANGAPIVSGYFSFGDTGLGANQRQGFLVEPGSYAHQLADYTDNLASSFFANAANTAGAPRPVLPADGGSVSIQTSTLAAAASTVNAGGASGGVGGLIEIAAPTSITIAASGDTAPATAGVVTIGADVLESWKPGQLVLGGTFSGSTTLNVVSTSITVQPGATLSADEVVLTASDSVTIDSGARISSTSAGAPAPVAGLVPTTISLTGPGASGAAFVGVSDLTNLLPGHPATPSGGANLGIVTLGAGSELATRGSVAIDAPGGATIADGSISGAGAAWSLGGAAQVIFGASIPTGTPANSMLIDPSLANALGGAGSVRLATSGAIEFTGNLNFGANGSGSPSDLTLIASSIQNVGTGNAVRLSSNAISLGGQGAAPAPTAGTGTFELDSNTISVGPGSLSVGGFRTVTLSAGDAVTGQGVGGLSVGGDLTVNSGYVTSSSGANTSIASTGTLTLGAGRAAPPHGLVPTGGTLALSGQRIVDAGSIVAPSGVVLLTSQTDMTLASTALIDVGGSPLSGAAAGYGTPGGLVQLSAVGNLSQAQGSRIEVSGGPSAYGGIVTITAGGSVALAGGIDSAGSGGVPSSGSFYLSAGSVTNFQTLISTLGSGGFGNTQSIRVASGDLMLSQQGAIAARNVLLETDGGAISVAGTINASGAGARPIVELDAATGLTLASTAVIDANATDASTKGGSITLSTAHGTLSIAPAAQLSAQGGAPTAAPGELVLRAPALASDVAITALPANTANVGRVVVEPWSVFALSSGAPVQAEFDADAASVSTYLSGAAGPIAQRLGLGANASISPFMQFTANGDLTLGNLELNTSNWRFNGAPGTLAITASGNITVAGTISDGFTVVPAAQSTATRLDLGATASSNIILTAGAANGAASANAVAIGAADNLSLAATSIVRTGTGDIVLNAPQDVSFAAGAAVYTGGLAGAPTVNNPKVSAAQPALFAAFPTQGGSIGINAGRDVIATPATVGPSAWQPRLQLPGALAATWGVNASAFRWTVGALGGGNVSVHAGRDVVDLSAAAADNAATDVNGVLQYFGGGNLVILSGRDTTSGMFYVGKGTGTITAYGALAADRSNPQQPGSTLGTMLFTGDASYRVQAVGNVVFEGDVPASVVYNGGQPELDFLRETPTDTLSVTSAGGNLDLHFANPAAGLAIGPAAYTNTSLQLKGLLPATSTFIAAAGNLSIEDGAPLLLPSDRGQLVLYAGGNILGVKSNTVFGMSDAPDALVPTAAAPIPYGITFNPEQLGDAQSARHTGDRNPILVYAGQDIDSLIVQSPKAITAYAGGNIQDLFLHATNTNSTDVSVETAGGSITTTFANLQNSDQIAGGGTFDLIAGKSIDLGFSLGITTLGNLTNRYLSTTTGANVTVLAGLGAPLGIDPPGTGTHHDFVADVILASLDPTTGQPLYQNQLISYVDSLGLAPANATAAANDFRSLTLTQQLPLLSSVLFQELVRSGREFNTLPVPAGTSGSSAGQLGAALNQSNLAKLINFIIAPSPVYQQQLVEYVQGATGKSGLSYADALAAFEKFPPALQVAFRYVRGYTAIAELFPGTDPFDALINHVIATDPAIVAANAAGGSGGRPFPGIAVIPPNPFQGDFSMTLGRVYTLGGGSIDILTPGGSIDVGLATTPPSISQLGIVRSPSDLGIVTEQAGDVNILTQGDVLVNSSRVFTLGGGNIAIWSSAGSIDAGRGAKSAISAPPPVVTVSATGQVSVDFSSAVAGSGIRTILTNPALPAGNVDLVAPIGTVNAGDAGIGASGNLNIAAASVAGLNNITVGGSSTGVPPTTSGVGVTVASAASAASSSSASSTSAVAPAAGSEAQKSPLSQAALSWLDVFVVGLGEESCRPDDLDCLKRQPKR